MKSAPIALAFLSCLLAAAPAIAEDKDKTYSIKYVRRAEVGDVYKIHNTFKIKRVPLGDTKDEDFENGAGEQLHGNVDAEIVGTMEVKAVDLNGTPKQFVLTLKTLKRDGNENADPSNKIFVERTADSVEMKEGESQENIDGDHAETLHLFIEKLNEADATDDDVFRSNKLRKVGDKWEADYDALENQAQGEGVEFERKQTSITAKLREVRAQDKKSSLIVEYDGKAGYKKLDLPEGLSLVESTSKFHGQFTLPEDKKAKAFARKISTELTVKTKRDDDGKVLHFKLVIEQSESITLANEGK